LVLSGVTFRSQGKQRKQNKKNCQRKIADFFGKMIRVLLLSPNFFSSIGLNRFKQSISGYTPTLKLWKNLCGLAVRSPISAYSRFDVALEPTKPAVPNTRLI